MVCMVWKCGKQTKRSSIQIIWLFGCFYCQNLYIILFIIVFFSLRIVYINYIFIWEILVKVLFPYCFQQLIDEWFWCEKHFRFVYQYFQSFLKNWYKKTKIIFSFSENHMRSEFLVFHIICPNEMFATEIHVIHDIYYK